MATAAQITANRTNSTKSTGPVTAEGKSASSRNSFKHGLTSKAVVLACEDPAEYETLRLSYHDEMKPCDTRETLAVEAIAQSWWRLGRAQSAELGFFDLRMKAISEKHPDLDSNACLSMVFNDPAESAALSRIQRYVRAAERNYWKALAAFKELRDQNVRELKAKMMLEEMRAQQQSHSEQSDQDELGFDSHLSIEPRKPQFTDRYYRAEPAPWTGHVNLDWDKINAKKAA